MYKYDKKKKNACITIKRKEGDRFMDIKRKDWRMRRYDESKIPKNEFQRKAKLPNYQIT